MKGKSLIRFYFCISLACLCLVFLTKNAHSTENVWDVLRAQFKLNHEVLQPEVQNQLRWLLAHPHYLQQLTQSEPYIYHIITEIRQRDLPGEIALIPMIESAYDPFAYSGAGAAGLWQLMPGTSNDLGLKRDWWLDGRRSIRSSTEAALNYLSYLNKIFAGNWLLAIAAYDAGEGTITRSIKNAAETTQVSFWTLRLPQETRAYIPRLLALAEIIQNPQHYQIQLPNIPHTPYFTEVNIGSQIDLSRAAKLAGISYKDLIKLNPGFNRWTTAPYYPYKLLIPANRVRDFSRNLANLPHENRVNWARHQVGIDDSLTSLAQRYHTTAHLIKELNQLQSDTLIQGQYVLIPSRINAAAEEASRAAAITPHPLSFKSSSQYKVIHIVQKNDSYRQLEKKYGISAAQICLWNRLNPTLPLQAGQQLIIWKKNTHAKTYIVQK